MLRWDLFVPYKINLLSHHMINLYAHAHRSRGIARATRQLKAAKQVSMGCSEGNLAPPAPYVDGKPRYYQR